MAERDNMFKKHPKTHVRRRAHRLARERSRAAGKLLDDMPNVYDRSRRGALRHRPPAARRARLLRQYQDRLLFGKDSFEPEEYPYYWRVFETADDYFDYYRDYHAFWKLYGIDLPDAVLKKLYFQNALKLTPGLPQTGWPR